MNEGQSLAQSLVARMQLAELGTANTVAHSVRVGRSIAEKLKDGGMIRRVSPKSKDPLRLSAICAVGKRAEAFGGYLYLVAAIRRDMTIQAGQVAHGVMDSACEVDIMPYCDVRQRIGLKQFEMIYRLLERIRKEPTRPDLLLIDRTLLLPKEFANSDDPQVQEDYQKVAKRGQAFWTEVESQLYPKTPGGLVVVGYTDDAIGAFRRLTSLSTTSPETRRAAETHLANIYLRLHRYEDAEAYVESAMKERPVPRDLLFNAAVVLGACTKLERALDLLDQVLLDEPKDGAALEKKAWVLWLMHRYEDAAHTARQALEIMPDNEVCLRRLVEYESLMGNPRRAEFFRTRLVNLSHE